MPLSTYGYPVTLYDNPMITGPESSIDLPRDMQPSGRLGMCSCRSQHLSDHRLGHSCLIRYT